MKHIRICLMTLVVAAAAIGVAACRKGAEQAVEQEPLLLLGDNASCPMLIERTHVVV